MRQMYIGFYDSRIFFFMRIQFVESKQSTQKRYTCIYICVYSNLQKPIRVKALGNGEFHYFPDRYRNAVRKLLTNFEQNRF